MKIKELLKSKSFWLGVAGVAGGIALVVTGEMDQGIAAIGAGLGMIFIRDAIAKK
jgi:hypothetical protein